MAISESESYISKDDIESVDDGEIKKLLTLLAGINRLMDNEAVKFKILESQKYLDNSFLSTGIKEKINKIAKGYDVDKLPSSYTLSSIIEDLECDIRRYKATKWPEWRKWLLRFGKVLAIGHFLFMFTIILIGLVYIHLLNGTKTVEEHVMGYGLYTLWFVCLLISLSKESMQKAVCVLRQTIEMSFQLEAKIPRMLRIIIILLIFGAAMTAFIAKNKL